MLPEPEKYPYDWHTFSHRLADYRYDGLPQSVCAYFEIEDTFASKNIIVQHINVGGGLGINYEHPNHFPIPNSNVFPDF